MPVGRWSEPTRVMRENAHIASEALWKPIKLTGLRKATAIHTRAGLFKRKDEVQDVDGMGLAQAGKHDVLNRGPAHAGKAASSSSVAFSFKEVGGDALSRLGRAGEPAPHSPLSSLCPFVGLVTSVSCPSVSWFFLPLPAASSF